MEETHTASCDAGHAHCVLPQRCAMEETRGTKLISLLAVVLEHISRTNADLRAVAPTSFDSVAVPPLTLKDYLKRLQYYTCLDFSCFCVALTYIDRLAHLDRRFCPTMHNIHRLLVVTLLVATKATEAPSHNNLFFARCAGIGVGELNKLEADLCRAL
eukprot:6097220-Prymnesium_polylepis.1